MPKGVKCENCNNLNADWWCEKVVDSPVPDMERDCSHYSQRTHADMIRAMPDDKLAEVFRAFCKGREDCEGCALYADCPGSDRLKPWQDWMKSPVFKEDAKC